MKRLVLGLLACAAYVAGSAVRGIDCGFVVGVCVGWSLGVSGGSRFDHASGSSQEEGSESLVGKRGEGWAGSSRVGWGVGLIVWPLTGRDVGRGRGCRPLLLVALEDPHHAAAWAGQGGGDTEGRGAL